MTSGCPSRGLLSVLPLTCSQVLSLLQGTYRVLSRQTQLGVPPIVACLWSLEIYPPSFLHCVLRTETVPTPKFVDKRVHQDAGQSTWYICSFFRLLLLLSFMHLSFLCVFTRLDSPFLFSTELYSIISGCTTIYLSICRLEGILVASKIWQS